IPFDVECKLFIGGATRGSLTVVGDARRRADEYELLHEVGPLECERQAQPSAHGVADIDPTAAACADARRRGEEVETLANLDGAQVPVARQRVDHWLPRIGRLGEAMDEDHAHGRMIAPCGWPR